MEILILLYGTLLLRPYVFVFLGVFLTISILNMGVARTLIYTGLAYTVAFSSEYSSTRNGFPYGFYTYIEATRNQELWISNVPFMDSISYVFLSYFSYATSLLIWSPLNIKGWDVRLVETESIKSSLRVILTGALLFMLLDVVIDPVALHGDQWFLGLIYFYREKGEYFNIPLTNFAGWFLVGATILYTFSRINIWLWVQNSAQCTGVRDLPGKALLGPAVYFGVLAFNLSVTFYIGETLMGLCGLLISLSILSLIFFKIKNPAAFLSKN